MRKTILRALAWMLCAVCLLGQISALAADAADPGTEAEPETAAEEEPQEPPRQISFLPYADALTFFDFDKAAYNWCTTFGMDPNTELGRARDAILAGTDPRLIIGLATFARDTGHGGEKLEVTNAFRPACYQEVIGLYSDNANTGAFRNSMRWNGESVTEFWWNAEHAANWPEGHSIDLSAFDVPTMDVRYFYRYALRLWDNTWIGNYYAKPGCSAHNSGTAIDLSNYWIAGNFDTVFTYNGEEYDMALYGLYKPLQPGPGTAGEAWHITCSPSVLALGNYDGALLAGYEIVYGLYYNPISRGWSMADGRGLYLGAGVAQIQLRLCQLGLLEQKYITGYYDSYTQNAVKAFQESHGLLGDTICGSATAAQLFAPETLSAEIQADTAAPVLNDAEVVSVGWKGFDLQVDAEDETQLNAFRVDTRKAGTETWVQRYYNAPASGAGVLDIDTWEEGRYEIRVAACDAAGNESELRDVESVFVDITPPRLVELILRNITEDGFDLTARATDNGELAGFTVTLVSDTGETRENFLLSDGSGDYPWRADELTEGTWTITVTAEDALGNTSTHTFHWQFTAGVPMPNVTVTWYPPAA